MTFHGNGLCPAAFAPLFALDDAALAGVNARRVLATGGEPCRVSLADAEVGDELILVHHVSHAVATPYRSAYAIFVRRSADAAAYRGSLPPMIERRRVGLRGFGADAMLRDAALAMPGEAQGALEGLLADRAIAYVDIHNAAHGCFLARAERA